MVEDLRRESFMVRQLFGDGARVKENGPTAKHLGTVVITVDGRERGRGVTLRQAMGQAMAHQEQQR